MREALSQRTPPGPPFVRGGQERAGPHPSSPPYEGGVRGGSSPQPEVGATQPFDALEESSRAFAQAIERAPDPSKRAELHRTRARLRSGRRDATPEQRTAALRDLDEAIRLDPADRSRVADDHVERARLLFAGGQPEAALAACAEAMRRVPDHAGAHRLRISSLLALKRHDEVLGSCDAYLAREEPTVEVLEIRGLARVARDDLPGAIADYTRAIELRPDTEPTIRARLLNHRGWAYHLADAPRLALADFEASLKQIEDQAEAHAGRGLARVRLGDWEKAVADADAAVRLASARATDESGPAPAARPASTRRGSMPRPPSTSRPASAARASAPSGSTAATALARSICFVRSSMRRPRRIAPPSWPTPRSGRSAPAAGRDNGESWRVGEIHRLTRLTMESSTPRGDANTPPPNPPFARGGKDRGRPT